MIQLYTINITRFHWCKINKNKLIYNESTNPITNKNEITKSINFTYMEAHCIRKVMNKKKFNTYNRLNLEYNNRHYPNLKKKKSTTLLHINLSEWKHPMHVVDKYACYVILPYISCIHLTFRLESLQSISLWIRLLFVWPDFLSKFTFGRTPINGNSYQ